MSALQPDPFTRAPCSAAARVNRRRGGRGVRRLIGPFVSEAGVIFAYALATLALAPAPALDLPPPVASMDSLQAVHIPPC